MLATVFAAAVLLIVSATAMYAVEHDENANLHSMPSACRAQSTAGGS